MSRALTVKNLYQKKFNTYPFKDIWHEVFGEPSTNGIWLIYGKEKNGKTWGTLLLADYLSQFEKVLYVSAEEGTDMEFQDAVTRARIEPDNRNIHFTEYETVEELYKRLKRRKAPRIVVLDNLTIYNEELKANGMKKLKQDFPNVLFICVAHEERNKPYTAAATMASKLAKVIIRVQGLMLIVGGRVPGGQLMVDEEKAQLYHGVQNS
jgi:adenosyl cobinamide kinase/adenosyl cobinamide phosphate guanylyltransferase